MFFYCFRSPNYKWGSVKWTMVSSLVRISGSDRANPNFRGNNSLSKAMVSTKRAGPTFTTRYWQIFFHWKTFIFYFWRDWIFSLKKAFLKQLISLNPNFFIDFTHILMVFVRKLNRNLKLWVQYAGPLLAGVSRIARNLSIWDFFLERIHKILANFRFTTLWRYDKTSFKRNRKYNLGEWRLEREITRTTTT